MSVTDGYPVVYYVKPDGSDGANGLTWATAFATLVFAKNTASAGNLIIVGPGTYNERPVGKNGVDWYFCQGATVQYTGSTNGAMWDDSSAGTNGAIVTRITGHGRFFHATSGSGDVAVFRVSNGSSRFYIECDRIQASSSSGGNQTGIYHTAGQVVARVETDIVSANYDGVILYGDANSSCRIWANRIIGTGDDGIECQAAGSVIVTAGLIRGTLGSGVNAGINAGTLNLTIHADEVVGAVNGAFLDGATGDYLNLDCGRITGGSGYGVSLTNGGTLVVNRGFIQSTGSHGVNVDAGTCLLNNVSVRGASSDLVRSGGTLAVAANCNYRRGNTSGTITEAPPADRVTTSLPNATAGASGGVFIAGTNAATTANITGNITGNLSGSVGSVASGGITASSFANNAIGSGAIASSAANEIADAWLDRADGVESGYTVREALRGMFSMLCGLNSGAGTGEEIFKAGGGGSTARLTWTVDASGNRTAIDVNL